MAVKYGDNVVLINKDGHVPAGSKGRVVSAPLLSSIDVEFDDKIDVGNGICQKIFTVAMSNLQLQSEITSGATTGNRKLTKDDFKEGDQFELIVDASSTLRTEMRGFVTNRDDKNTFIADMGDNFKSGSAYDKRYGANYTGFTRVYYEHCRKIVPLFGKQDSWTREDIEHLWNVTQTAGAGC